MRWALGAAVLLAGAAALVPACGGGTPGTSESGSPAGGVSPKEEAGEARVTTLVEGAQFPVSLAFAPDGRLFYNELRSGRIRIVQDGRLQDEPFAELKVVNLSSYSEHGLLGLAIDPDFEENHYVYAFYSVPDQAGNPWKQRVVRFREVNGRGTEMTVVLDGLPIGPSCCHNGGRLAFGPDGKLYVSIGDAQEPEAAQDTGRLSGKVLRIERDGSIPKDNPIPGSPVWAWGLRNAFGLAFAPDGSLYATENGPDGYDEINRIVRGGNYGWPEVKGVAHDPRFIDPLYSRPDYRVAPTGITFYHGADLPELKGSLLFCNFNEGALTQAAPRDSGLELTDTGQRCSLDVVTGPDGALYFSDADNIYRWGLP